MISENINTHSIDFREVSWQGRGEGGKGSKAKIFYFSSESDNSREFQGKGFYAKSLLWGGIMFSGTTQ